MGTHIPKKVVMFGWNLQLSPISLSKPRPLQKTTKKSSSTFLAVVVAAPLKLLAAQCLPKIIKLGTNPACGGHAITPYI